MAVKRQSGKDVKIYGDIKLYAGTGNPELADKIAKYLDHELSGRDIIEFPNENLMVKLHDSARGQDVYVIQSTSTPVHRNIMELLIMLQTLRLDSAGRITAVLPYLAYARSDKKDQPRVPITARLMADMIPARMPKIISMGASAKGNPGKLMEVRMYMEAEYGI